MKTVIPFTGIGLHFFAGKVELLVARVMNLQRAALAVKRAERTRFLPARMAAALVPADAHLAEVIRRIARVRRLLIIIEMIPRAIHGHALRIIHLQSPARHVHEMRPVVLHLATAIKPVPMPVVMHEVILVRPLGARPLPQFPAFLAQPLRHLHKFPLADAAAPPAVIAPRKRRLTNLARLHPLHALDDARLAAALIAHLHLLLVLLCCGHDQLRLARILAGRLLHVHVLARLHRQDRHRRVPKIRRRN